MLKHLIILAVALMLVSLAFIPLVHAETTKTAIHQQFLTTRDELFQKLTNNDWKDLFDIFILAIILFLLYIIESYVVFVTYNEDNDLYPLLTEIVKKVFMLPMLFLTGLMLLLIILFKPPFPYP
jgi:hypothetical protein